MKHLLKLMDLSKEEIQQKLDAGVPYVIRMNAPTEGESSYEDVVFGKITFPNDTLDDMVLIKQDGMPTYNFANVIRLSKPALHYTLSIFLNYLFFIIFCLINGIKRHNFSLKMRITLNYMLKITPLFQISTLLLPFFSAIFAIGIAIIKQIKLKNAKQIEAKFCASV